MTAPGNGGSDPWTQPRSPDIDVGWPWWEPLHLHIWRPNVLLDGLVGAVLAGAVTAWAVTWTLRHERKAELRGRRTQAAGQTIASAERLRGLLNSEGAVSLAAAHAYNELLAQVHIFNVFVLKPRQVFFGTVIDEVMRRACS